MLENWKNSFVLVIHVDPQFILKEIKPKIAQKRNAATPNYAIRNLTFYKTT